MPRRRPTEATAATEDSNATTEMPAQTAEAPQAAEAVKMNVEKGEKKTGQELLDFISSNKNQPIDDVIYNAGYYTRKTNTETNEVKVTLHKPQFWEAVAAASNPGIEFAPPKRAYSARAGRQPIATVVKNGQIVVGPRHGAAAGFEPGSKVLIEATEGQIVITAYVGGDDDASEDQSDMDL